MAGQKPKYKFAAKPRSGGKTLGIAAFWKNGEYLGGSLDGNVESLKLTTGEVITNDDYYMNLYVNDDEQNQEQPVENEHDQGEEDVPF